MKIALIGDLQYRVGEEPEIAANLSEVAELKPDFAVFMGDMGAGRQTGTYEGMKICRDLLNILPCPTAVLLGNHDVEYRPDDATARMPDAWYRALFHREHPWQAAELGGVFLLCVSAERQPEDTLLTQHALYVSDEQYAWARAQLNAHRHLPAILFTHAPAAGSGLRCCPPIHSAATDAHLDHSFDALRWRHLMSEHPQIKLWCSAHFHMSHDYDAAITCRKGVTHVSTGVLTSAARDGSRHTRILDIDAGVVGIRTLDHRTHTLRTDARVWLDGSREPQGRLAPDYPDEAFLGDDHALKAWYCPEWQRFYVFTQGGMLWEYACELQELTGAIAQRLSSVESLHANGDRLTVHAGNAIWSVQKDDRARFERRSGYVPPNRTPVDAPAGVLLPAIQFSVRSAPEGEHIQFKGGQRL